MIFHIWGLDLQQTKLSSSGFKSLCLSIHIQQRRGREHWLNILHCWIHFLWLPFHLVHFIPFQQIQTSIPSINHNRFWWWNWIIVVSHWVLMSSITICIYSAVKKNLPCRWFLRFCIFITFISFKSLKQFCNYINTSECKIHFLNDFIYLGIKAIQT